MNHFPLGAALLLFSSFAVAQGVAPAITDPQQKPSEYHINWARHFFSSAEAEKADRAELYSALKQLQAFRGRVAESGEYLLRTLRLRDQIEQGFAKHEAYLHLRSSVNTQDKASAADEDRLDADFNQQTAFVDAEILAMPAERVRMYIKNTPGLEQYEFAIERVERDKAHTRAVDEEELLTELSPELTGWPSMLYDELMEATKFEPVTVEGKPVDPQRDRRRLASSRDAQVRQQGFAKRYAGFAGMSSLYAFTLGRLVAANSSVAKLHNFASAPEQFYWRSFLSRADVDRLLTAVANHAPIYKEYEQVRAEHVQRALGIQQARVWDLDAVTLSSAPRFTYDEMRDLLAHALSPLGDDYVREMSSLLDPANGRVDVASGSHRRRSGFSKGFPGFASVFFAGDFTGSYNDMRVIAHEGGHAVHREFMTKAGTIPAYAEGPHFLFESFAAFNELLLADYMSAHAQTPELKAWYKEQFLEGKGTVAFVAGPEAQLEERIYDESQQGRTLNGESLDQLTQSVYAKYSNYAVSTPEMRHEWMMIPLMYEDPFYDVNYVYAGVLALKYYEMMEEDPAGFRTRYMNMLRNGFNASPQELLKSFLQIDLGDPNLVNSAMKVVAARVEELRKLQGTTTDLHH